MQDETMEKESVSLKAIGALLARRWWVILLAGILCAGILVACTAFFGRDQYRASVLLYVNNATNDHGSSTGKITLSDLDAAQSLVSTYCVLAESRKTLDQVKEKENLPYSYEQLKSMVDATGVETTEIFRVTVTSRSADEAKVIANTVAWVLEKDIPNTITGSSVKIVEDAVRPNAPVSRGYTKKGIVGFVGGIFVAMCAVLLFDGYVHDTIKSQDWLEEYYGESVPILASIPDSNAPSDASKYGYYARHRQEHEGEYTRKGDGK